MEKILEYFECQDVNNERFTKVYVAVQFWKRLLKMVNGLRIKLRSCIYFSSFFEILKAHIYVWYINWPPSSSLNSLPINYITFSPLRAVQFLIVTIVIMAFSKQNVNVHYVCWHSPCAPYVRIIKFFGSEHRIARIDLSAGLYFLLVFFLSRDFISDIISFAYCCVPF